jgi:hypothetical protein
VGIRIGRELCEPTKLWFPARVAADTQIRVAERRGREERKDTLVIILVVVFLGTVKGGVIRAAHGILSVGRVEKVGPGVPRKHLQNDDLAPLVHVDQGVAELTKVLVNQVKPGKRERVEERGVSRLADMCSLHGVPLLQN